MESVNTYELRDNIEPIEHQRIQGQDYYLDAQRKVWAWRPRLQRYIRVNHAGRMHELGWVRR